MYSSDDDILMETNGNDSSSSDFGKAISRKKRKKAIENTEHHPSKHMKHQNMQNVLETFACEVCSKTFKYKKGLARHLNSEHMEVQTSFPCESCSKSFKYKHSLTVHIKSQHADVEARFSCEACPKTFKYKQDLTIHFNSKHMEGTGEIVKYVSRPFKTKKVLQSMSSLYTSNANGVITKAKVKMKTWKNIIGIPTKKKLSKRKLTKLILLTVSKRKHKNHINVAGVVTGGTNGSVLLGKIFAVSGLGLP